MTVNNADSQWQWFVDWLTAGRLPRCPDYMRHFSRFSLREIQRQLHWILREKAPMESWRDTFHLGREWRAEGYNWLGGKTPGQWFGGPPRGYPYRKQAWECWRGHRNWERSLKRG